jgi:hypothetical protein
MRSDDGASTFQTFPIPGTADQRLAYIAAVHPLDPDRVFIRIDDTPGTVIWSTVDGGNTLQERFTGAGPLPGFAMAPDGSHIVFGGPTDGIWSGAEDATTFDRRSSVGATCLSWNADGLYACADQTYDPFSIGRSVDMAATFETLLRFDTLCGATACAGTQAALCAPEWEAIAPMLGSTCRMDAGVTDASTPAPPDAADGGRDAVSNVSGSEPSGSSEAGQGAPAPHSGCQCNLALPKGIGSTGAWWGTFVALVLGRSRRRMKPRP